MSSTIHLKAFLTRLDNFITEMIETYPEQADKLKKGQRAYNLARDANPRLICTLFRQHVVEPFETQIMSKDENFIRGAAKSKLATEFPEFYEFFEPCVKIWDDMSEESKSAMWKHVQVLHILSKRVV
jgi:hypothetical protein